MASAARLRQADLTRALRAAEASIQRATAAGLKPSGIKVEPDGTVHILFEEASGSRKNPLDRLLDQ